MARKRANANAGHGYTRILTDECTNHALSVSIRGLKTRRRLRLRLTTHYPWRSVSIRGLKNQEALAPPPEMASPTLKDHGT